MGQLEELGKTYPFDIPPFFALVLRAFSVIEGIALAADPDYAIVRECFPYISRCVPLLLASWLDVPGGCSVWGG